MALIKKDIIASVVMSRFMFTLILFEVAFILLCI